MALVCDPNEDPEAHMGEVIPDPWADPNQADWPMNEEVEDEHSVGTDQGHDDPA